MSIPLTPYLRDDAVLSALRGRDRDTVLAELAGPLLTDLPAAVGSTAHRVLVAREDLGSTGVGEGVAIPHGKVAGLPGVRLAVGLHRTGVPFAAADGRPVHLFFLLLAPEAGGGEHLQLLARIARIARNPVARETLLAVENDAALLDTLRGLDAAEGR